MRIGKVNEAWKDGIQFNAAQKKARRKEKHYVLCVVELFFFLAHAKVELNEMNTKLQIEHKYMACLVVALFFSILFLLLAVRVLSSLLNNDRKKSDQRLRVVHILIRQNL